MADIEHDIRVIAISLTMQEELAQLEADGWQLFPGVAPVAVYHLVRDNSRPKPQSAIGALGTIKIDESKVRVLRDGKLLDS